MTARNLNQINIENYRFEVHNYTGICPKNVIELNPIEINCGYNCIYCLVNNGLHNEIQVIDNYELKVKDILEQKRNENTFFYFSPKSEALQEATLKTGAAHKIIKTFIEHYTKFPDSKVRLFIASKAGVDQINYKYKGDSILYLMSLISGKVQFNTSLALMPEDIRIRIELNTPTIDERLEAVCLLQENGILAESVLMQPIITTYCNEISVFNFMTTIHKSGLQNIKPEFLTTTKENIIKVGEIIGSVNKTEQDAFYHDYFSLVNQSHIKHNDRLAPERDICKEKLELISTIAESMDISISICNWVRKELSINSNIIKYRNERNYECLGYKTTLFNQ
jgi:DNA repair photolyase